MNTIRKSSYLTLVAALQVLALDASAMSIGRLKGTALLGQPMELVANLQFAADEVPDADCVEATVRYGSNTLPGGQVTVSMLPSAQSRTVPVLISADSKVNEPVVTITLSAGCLLKVSKQFVVLSELVSEPQTVPVPREKVTYAPPVAPVVSAPSLGAKQSKSKSTVPMGTAAPSVQAKLAEVAPVKRKQHKKAKHSKQEQAGVLQLTPSAKKAAVEAARSGITSADLASIEELSRRVEAIAEWKAANPGGVATSPQDDTLAQLQQGLKALQAVTNKNSKDLQNLALEVEASRSRGTGKWVYGVGALLALALAFAAWVAMRTRRTGDVPTWWGATQANENLLDPVKELGAVDKSASEQQDSEVTDSANASAAEPLDTVDIDLAAAPVGGVVGASVRPSDIKRTDKRDFAHSGSATLRAINTKEMFDVRQQAEFFMALGQHDEAIKVLEHSNLESEESNPLVLLDLLKILHTLSRRTEFDRYRSEFNVLFTGLVPSYTEFLSEGNSLDSYPDIVRQIQDLWPGDDAMDYLEQCMVRTPDDGATQGFEIAAFRDLLTLHGVLRRLDTQDLDSNLAPFSANRGAASVLSTLDSDADAQRSNEVDSSLTPLPVLPDTEKSRDAAAPMDLALDLDLDSSPPALPNLMEFDVKGLGTFGPPRK